MLQLQQRVLDVNMNPNRPYYLGQNHRYQALQSSEAKPRSYSLQINNSRLAASSNHEIDLRSSLLAQSHLEHQEKLQHMMAMQNELLRQKLIEIENKQLRLQNEMLQKHVQQMETEFENTLRTLNKQKQIQVHGQQTSRPISIQTPHKYQMPRLQQQKDTMSQQSNLNKNENSLLQDDGVSQNSKLIFDTPQPFQIQEDYQYKFKQPVLNPLPKQNKGKSKPKKQNLRKFLLAVQAYVRWSKNYRLKRKDLVGKLKAVKAKFEAVKMKILAVTEDTIKELLTQWVQDIFDSFITELNKPSFISHCEDEKYDPNADESILYRQQMIIKLSGDFFQHLEKMTRVNALPSIIVYLIYLSLFVSQNPQVSLYVAKRTNFYQKNSVKIPSIQEKLIIGEYLFFRLIISQMIRLFNNLKYRNIMHEKQCKFFSSIIASLIQIVYMDYFEDVKAVSNINVELYQRKIVIGENNKAMMIEDKNIDEDEILIIGLYDKSAFGNLFEDETNWITSIGNSFHQILTNLHNQL